VTVSDTAETVKMIVILPPLPKRIGFAGLGCYPRSAAVRDANNAPLAPAVQNSILTQTIRHEPDGRSVHREPRFRPRAADSETSCFSRHFIGWNRTGRCRSTLSFGPDDVSGSLSGAHPLLMPFNELLSLSLPVFRSDF